MRLSDWLDEKRMTREAFGMRIGVNTASVTRYALGARTPRPAIMARIIAETGGAVTANDFLPPAAPPREPVRQAG